jgi:hypothetical protein
VTTSDKIESSAGQKRKVKLTPYDTSNSSNFPKNWHSIGGLSVLFMNPSLAGRVGSRDHIKSREKGFKSNDSENPFLNIKRAFEVIDSKRKQEEALREKGPVFGEEINYDK